ncbi:hypothetical protein Noc_1208 [Nitrosococcus oceani ATCC 19707]|uniref:Uncharacterized protein n=2 Tax=Nitrosococcus oceani TaxID=1229 RepID=Q3JBT7_NITOC|nr:DUF6384 family protein [Nitrosococcus oceani]ABA57709.1 hypothetical protein Noc_1208 [Nitrosococcus oceani ATCC 19707]EDZ68123.1 hypothetical protein NOC27_1450 [Nitrosococcus oceani AFC27]KFI19879.1 hypothetical protein IB75_06295 [Nitrosococcus oceani C-27]GEM19362.1 hypothetical protein NONS58_07470 [Nitrosococcus oceani]
MNTEATSATAGASAKQPLDEIMLAMDVVDTLRRRERLVKREIEVEGREQDLKERLRKIYQAQGIEVSDRILAEGVAALREDRFVYKPPAESFHVKLARLYVSRNRWGKWLLGGIGVLIIAWTVNYFVFVAPSKALPEEIATVHAEVTEIARSDRARERAEQLLNAGQTALDNENKDAARQALRLLEDLRTRLEQEYTLRIVNRPREQSGVWRVPDINTRARNYYLIVEAIDPSGKVLTVPVTNEETGKIERVTQWGLRVDEATFQRVARDKQNNGIIEEDRVGHKKRGYLRPDYKIRTTGGAITQW